MFAHAFFCITALGLVLPSTVSAVSRLEGTDFASSVTDIPPLGLGTWLSDRDKVAHAVEYAIGAGYKHIDAALIYGNEDKVGQGIAKSGIKRSDLWVTSKLWNTDHTPQRAHEAIEKTISDLGVDYLDLYLIHWPVAFKPGDGKELDRQTTILDTWRALEDLVRQNRTRYIGISNFAPADVKLLLKEAEIQPYAHEFETHPYLQQQEWVDWHLERGIKVIAYSPLGNTNPTYDSPPKVPALLDDPFWKGLAREKDNATVAQAVLAWGLQRGLVVIPKSVHEGYIEENLRALEVGAFTEEERGEVEGRDRKVRLNSPGKGWGVDLFRGLDDPTNLDSEEEDEGGLEL